MPSILAHIILGLPLIAGSRIGPYQIVAPIGAGGMGEVYRARDTRLGRDVAIKVIASAFATDADRVARFEFEARATATLNHPNVLAMYDAGVEGKTPYVVSELLEGETLRTMLSRGALPTRVAVELAIQIARGLAAAQDKGIVHRDLKPENVFVTKDGRAKILDFGLAKLIEPDVPDGGLSSAATTHRPTMAGTVMGTVGYMAPEQVRGEAADRRADIFAFGAVVYEMLSGRRAFARGTAIETMAAVLNDDPPEWTAPAGGVPTVLDRIVRRCLEKNAEQRFQWASDIAFALDAASGSIVGTAVVATRAPAPRRWATAAVVAVVMVGVAGAFFVIGRSRSAALLEAPTFQARTFDRLPITNARFMPDDRTIVYSAASHGYTPELFVSNPNTEAPRALGVPSAQLLSVSSKGELAIILGARHLDQRLYGGTLARMTLGSTPRPVLEGVREADWAPDGGSLAITRDLGNGRDRLEYPIGTALYEMTGYLSDLRVSPDGGRVAFFEHPWRFDDRGWVKVVDRHAKVTTLAGEFAGLQGLAWTRDGSTILFSGNPASGYYLQPMAVSAYGGRPAWTVLGVPGRFIVYDTSSDGRWLAVREDLSFGVRARVPGELAERELSWLGSVGVEAMSADGQWLLMVDSGPMAGANYGVVLRKTDGSQTVRLGEGNPQKLSPDGKWAAATVATPQALVIYPTGAGEPIRMAGPIERYGSAEWFPDSKRLLVCGSEPMHAPRCYEQDLAGSPPRPVTAEGVLATLAPDAKTLLLVAPGGKFARSSVNGGAATPISAFHADDRPIGWSRDSLAVFVQRGLEAPAIVERVDLASGLRTPAGQVSAEGVASITQINVKAWIDDGRWYAYNYTTVPSTLFLVSGASGRVSVPTGIFGIGR